MTATQTSRRYTEVPAADVPTGLIFVTPARHQGQIVEVSYSTGRRGGNHDADEGDPWMMETDHSTGSTRYYRLVEYRTYWTCEGSVRRGCGTQHRTYEAARAHCDRDQRDVKHGHGQSAYSDRTPVEVEVAR